MSPDVAELRAKAAPRLNPQPIAVVALGPDASPWRERALGAFREAEGWTLYMDLAEAEAAGLRIVFRAAWITMTVESALDAVGFTAAFSRVLAEAGIACNVVAGARHDHLFVPLEQAEAAMAALRRL